MRSFPAAPLYQPILSYAHLYEEAGLDSTGSCAAPPCGASGNRFVVLITDGADSCPEEPFEGACGGLPCTDFLLDASVHDAAAKMLMANQG